MTWRTAIIIRQTDSSRWAVGRKLKVEEFFGSVKRLAWAKKNGCPWTERVCVLIARGGDLAVLKWARKHGCAWWVGTSYIVLYPRGKLLKPHPQVLKRRYDELPSSFALNSNSRPHKVGRDDVRGGR
jgi:hypothetical protein